MSQSGEQLNHAIRQSWKTDEHIFDVEERYLRIIQGLIAHSGGEVELNPDILFEQVDFESNFSSGGRIVLRIPDL